MKEVRDIAPLSPISPLGSLRQRSFTLAPPLCSYDRITAASEEREVAAAVGVRFCVVVEGSLRPPSFLATQSQLFIPLFIAGDYPFPSPILLCSPSSYFFRRPTHGDGTEALWRIIVEIKPAQPASTWSWKSKKLRKTSHRDPTHPPAARYINPRRPINTIATLTSLSIETLKPRSALIQQSSVRKTITVYFSSHTHTPFLYLCVILRVSRVRVCVSRKVANE